MEHDRTVERAWRVLEGESGEPGLMTKVRELELWRRIVDDERLRFKALVIGAVIGLGFNGAVSVLTLIKLLGG